MMRGEREKEESVFENIADKKVDIFNGSDVVIEWKPVRCVGPRRNDSGNKIKLSNKTVTFIFC